MMDNEMKQILLHAQLDLNMLLEHFVGLRDSRGVNVAAAKATLAELRALTGDDCSKWAEELEEE